MLFYLKGFLYLLCIFIEVRVIVRWEQTPMQFKTEVYDTTRLQDRENLCNILAPFSEI